MNVGNAVRNIPRAAHLGPERRRPLVLEAARQLAAEVGIQGVSMDSVARRLQVTRPVLYACFASRDALIAALLDQEETRLMEGVLAALPAKPSFSRPENLLIEGFQALLKVIAEHSASWKIVFVNDPDPAVAERFGGARKRVAARITTLLGPGLKFAGVKEVERKLPVLVELFMAAADGAVRAQAQTKGRWSTDELGAYVGRIVFGALSRA